MNIPLPSAATIVALLLLVPLLTGCRTARDAAETSVDVAEHAVDKTGRVLKHGARKIDRNL